MYYEINLVALKKVKKFNKLEKASFWIAGVYMAIGLFLPATPSQETEGRKVVVKASNPEKDAYCRPVYQRLSKDTYNLCIKEGMSYQEVVSIVGHSGKVISVSKKAAVMQWKGEGRGEMRSGYMTLSFRNGALISKNQVNLEYDRYDCDFKGCIQYQLDREWEVRTGEKL